MVQLYSKNNHNSVKLTFGIKSAGGRIFCLGRQHINRTDTASKTITIIVRPEIAAIMTGENLLPTNLENVKKRY